MGSALTLTAKNGDIRGTVTGGYDDFAMTSEVKREPAICRLTRKADSKL